MTWRRSVAMGAAMSEALDTVTAADIGADVSAVTASAANPAPILGVTLKRNVHELNSSLKNDPEMAEGQGAAADSASPYSFGDVTAVTAVTPNNGAGSGVTANETAAVTAVTELADLIETATADDGGHIEKPDAQSVPEDDRPCFKVYDDWTLLDTGRKLRPGVWHHTMSAPRGGGEPFPVDTWVCGPLHIEAQTFDGTGNNFGRLLRFKNTAGRWRTWAMPMELLRGDGSDLRGELLAMGLAIDPFARQTLARYLQEREPKRRVRCALQVGWCGKSFVLPDAVIGPDAADVIFQSGERGHDEHGQAGTLGGWQTEIAAKAVGNPLFVLALSASFAGPLLKRTNTEGGGLHFVGDSSTGKTTILEAACSVWGGPGYRRSWRATANGTEGAAALCNDCLLALDEISECDPREVGAIVYSLGNGRGKQRASRTGAARSVTRWTTFIVSTGERTISTTMMEGGHRAKAGQAVRLLDIPAARRFGCFDTLHDLPTGTGLSDAIKRAAGLHYGRAGRAFLERLAHDLRDFAALLERFKALPGFNPQAAEGQDRRAAGRFALLALAGELATEYGITGWPEGAALDAATVGFTAWRSLRGRGNDERRQILDRLAGFLERHGDSRFSDWTADGVMIRDRAGWWKPDDQGGRLYLFNSDGLREALKGFDFKQALDQLESCGAIPKAGATGERRSQMRIGGRPTKVYIVDPCKLDGEK